MRVITAASTPVERVALAYLNIVRWLYKKRWRRTQKLLFVLLTFFKLTRFILKTKEHVFSHGEYKFAGSFQNPRILMTYFNGLPEVVYPRAVKELVPPDGVVFDVGATFGFHTMIYAKNLVPCGRVWSFEPGSRSYELISRNIELNGLTNVVCCQHGLSDSNHQLPLGIPSKSQHSRYAARGFWAITDGLNSVYARSASGSAIGELREFVKLDDFVVRNKIERLDFIKIDVEGHELAVLRGGVASLERFRPVIKIEINSFTMAIANVNANELFDWVEQMGYEVFVEAGLDIMPFARKQLTDGSYAVGRAIPFLFNGILIHKERSILPAR